jgi:hypothetical protein
MSIKTVKKIQTILDVTADGIWGPKSQATLNSQIGSTAGKGNPVLAKIQKLLGVEADGFWGPISQEALNKVLGVSDAPGAGNPGGEGGGADVGVWFAAEASSFADPADVRAFQRCKEQGKTDQQCFRVGDNGIGQFGKITAQAHTAMVALHRTDMIARWGSVQGAAHRRVFVRVNGRTIEATVEDRLGVAGRIDLNPACAAQLGLNPPFLVPRRNCSWRWA